MAAMKHPYESLPENPQAAVTIMTTEHFNLQTARSATISESNGRTSIFLGAVSAGLVALAFAGQTSRSTLLTFGLVLFPVLSFLGLVTFERVLQSSIEDTLYLQRINRIRRFYHEAAPGLSPVPEAVPVRRCAAVLTARLIRVESPEAVGEHPCCLHCSVSTATCIAYLSLGDNGRRGPPG
jgi:hypothetical protein